VRGRHEVLFTAVHPDEQVAPDAFQVFALGGKTAEEIGRLLTTLGDQLVTDGVVQGGALVRALHRAGRRADRRLRHLRHRRRIHDPPGLL
jgi:hypothetical protein